MRKITAKPRFQGKAGAWLILHNDGKLLLARRAPYCKLDVGLWNWIGGGVDEGETPYVAALREFQEEAGYDMMPFQDSITHLLSVGNPIEGGQCHYFIAQAPEGFKPTFNQETDAAKWVSIADLLAAPQELNWPTLASLGAVSAYLSQQGLT